MKKVVSKKGKQFFFGLGTLAIVTGVPLTLAASCGNEQKQSEENPMELKNVEYGQFDGLNFNDEDWDRKGWFFEKAGYTRENINYTGIKGFKGAAIATLNLPNATEIGYESFIGIKI